MITRESFVNNPEEVTHLIRWWISQDGYRYHRVRRLGTVRDFIQEVWAQLLTNIPHGKFLPFALSTVVTNHCMWTLGKLSPQPAIQSGAFRWVFAYNMRTARPVMADDMISEAEIAEDHAIQRELEDAIVSLMKTLTYREAVVLRARLGLFGDNEQTLEQVGRSLGVTRERVRQIESVAVKKLQHYKRARKLIPFLPLCHDRRMREAREQQMQSTEYGAALYADLMEDVTSDTET